MKFPLAALAVAVLATPTLVLGEELPTLEDQVACLIGQAAISVLGQFSSGHDAEKAAEIAIKQGEHCLPAQSPRCRVRLCRRGGRGNSQKHRAQRSDR